MAQRELRLCVSRRTVVCTFASPALWACQAMANPIGMSLLFQNKGSFGIGVRRFDPDGHRGPVPGALGPGGGGAQMSFMPGDSNRPVPRFVEITWWQETLESIELQKSVEMPKGSISKEIWADFLRRQDEVRAKGLTFHRTVDLTSVITPALLAEVRSNPRGTNLKLLVLFGNGNVTIKALAEKWR